MLYQERLKKWAVVRMTVGAKPVILERFRSVADAEGHLKALKNQMPREQLMVIFDRPQVADPVSEETGSSADIEENSPSEASAT